MPIRIWEIYHYKTEGAIFIETKINKKTRYYALYCLYSVVSKYPSIVLIVGVSSVVEILSTAGLFSAIELVSTISSSTISSSIISGSSFFLRTIDLNAITKFNKKKTL